ncbi:MAG: YHYH protein [Leptospiraceae bacterium]|nr:YHYH protein [Leptospiraceae bacterium]MCP5513700.1 YHYH protein [Leptospiraceae bacterium]
MKKSIFLFVVLLTLEACSVLNQSKDDSTDTTALAALVLLNSRTSVAYTLDTTTGCISGVATSLDTSLPSWIKDNFKCQTVKVNGSNYVFSVTDLPNHKSYYYGSTSSLYEALPSGNRSAGNNTITAQSITLTIPSSPSSASSKTATGLSTIGVSVNGVSIFSNDAAPGDTLSSEVATFDKYAGHPQDAGIFHYHAEPTYISNSDSSLIGIALDGYAIYGSKCQQNGTDITPTISTSSTDTTTTLDTNHGHTSVTKNFTTATYHYHLAYDSTATISTLLGDYYHGTPGTSN